jgi:hypothetical protein
MRCAILALGLLAAPALGETPGLALAPAGECAGEERELAPRASARAQDGDAEAPAPIPAATGPNALAHLTPLPPVAGGASPLAPPASSAFEGPGPCDTPGSGCAVKTLVDDPDPGTGCGLPGSACP